MPVGRICRWPHLLGALGLAALSGCVTAPLPVEGLPVRPLDVTEALVAAEHPPPPRPMPHQPLAATTPLGDRLGVPPGLPGAGAGTVRLPPLDPNMRSEFDKAVAGLFPDPPPLPADVVPAGTTLTLADLQTLALSSHPSLRQAAADVRAAQGAAIQAGLPPNPSFGYEGDTIGSGRTAGQQGVKYEQVIKTAGKLGLAQASALTEVTSAQVALRKAQVDLVTQVRTAYFAVLVAQEQVRVTDLVMRLIDEGFRVTVDQLRSGQNAPYEPAQVRALAVQTRAALAQARNRYHSAWRQLTAAVGRPDLPPGPLAGSAIMPPPAFRYPAVHKRMLDGHTDLRAAEAAAARARVQLQLAEVTRTPDVALKVVVQKDYSTPPFATSANVEVGVPVPVWDRNQGGIQQAQGQLARAIDEAGRVRLDLLAKLADAHERYATNRQLVEAFQAQILPDQVRYYRGALERHQQEPDKVDFPQVFDALERLSSSLTSYLTALDAQWKAVVDVAALAQLDDLYAVCTEP